MAEWDLTEQVPGPRRMCGGLNTYPRRELAVVGDDRLARKLIQG